VVITIAGATSSVVLAAAANSFPAPATPRSIHPARTPRVPSRNVVQRSFDTCGKSHFTRKRSGTWRRKLGEVDQSLNLQKSQYSLRYYVNVGLAFSAEGEGAYIRGRAEGLLRPEDGERLVTLLDLDGHSMIDEHREAELLALFDRLVEVLDDLASIEAVAAKDADGGFKAMGVTGPARAAIDRSR
jgi:hypothetical protein